MGGAELPKRGTDPILGAESSSGVGQACRFAVDSMERPHPVGVMSPVAFGCGVLGAADSTGAAR